MAKNRSRRLRKKMHIDEFQELGFSVAWRFPEGTSEEQIDKTVDDFINEVIEPNKLAFDGSGYLAWEGLICMQEIGKCVSGWKNANWKRYAPANFSTFGGTKKAYGR